MNVDHVVKVRQTQMSPTYAGFQTFKDPVVIERASMQYCYGPKGQKYLDLLARCVFRRAFALRFLASMPTPACSNLTISVGHAHPRVTAAVKAQLDKLPHLSSMYYSEPVSMLTEKVTVPLAQIKFTIAIPRAALLTNAKSLTRRL